MELIGTTNLHQLGPGSNSNEKVLHTLELEPYNLMQFDVNAGTLRGGLTTLQITHSCQFLSNPD